MDMIQALLPWIILLCISTMASVVMLQVLHPGDNTAVIALLLGIIAPIVGAYVSLMVGLKNREDTYRQGRIVDNLRERNDEEYVEYHERAKHEDLLRRNLGLKKDDGSEK